jgi:hypothetical protein
MKEFLIALVFVVVLIGSTVQQWAPDAWAQILRMFGL